MTNDTTSHLDLTLMVAFHDAFRRDLAHLAHATSRHRAQLDEPNRRTAVQAGWELFKTELHIHHTAEDADLWPRLRTKTAATSAWGTPSMPWPASCTGICATRSATRSR